MRRALSALMFLLVLLPLIPDTAAAQVHRFEITPFAGYRLSGEVDDSTDLGFDFDDNVEIDESAVFGFIFDIPLTPNWQLELLANRQRTSFSVDEGLFSPTEELGDLDLGFYHAGLLFQGGQGQVNPFIVGSIGLARLEPDFPELDAENYFSASLGGGVKIFLSENVGLRLEGRGYWTDVDTNFDERYDRYDASGAIYQVEGTAGLIIAF